MACFLIIELVDRDKIGQAVVAESSNAYLASCAVTYNVRRFGAERRPHSVELSDRRYLT